MQNDEYSAIKQRDNKIKEQLGKLNTNTYNNQKNTEWRTNNV